MNTKIIFLGGIWNKNEEGEIISKSKCGVQIAANVLQKAIINGLDACIDNPVTVISEKFIGAFPNKYREWDIKSKTFNHSLRTGHKDYDIEFVNLPLIKHCSKYINSKKYIKKVCSECSANKIYVIGYSMTYSIVNGLLYASKIDARVKTCLIVPDLPEFMNLGQKNNIIIASIKKIVTNKLYKQIKKIDSFVVLTQYIYERLGVDKPFRVVEGVATSDVVQYKMKQKTNVKNFVYTGSLDSKYGIVELVNAFTKIQDESLRLVICGYGDSVSYIKNMSKKNKRIVFMGTVDNDTAKQIQCNAFVLVNPRRMDEEYTKYSFPSKTMEYLLAARPVIMYKLKGIPDEYDEFLYYVDNSLEETMRKLLLIDEEQLREKALRGKKFVLENKNAKRQAEKIIMMLEAL